MPSTTWGALTDEHINHTIVFTLPWATEPVGYVLLSVDANDRTSYIYDREAGEPGSICTLDVPEWGGPNQFMLPNMLPVTATPAT